MNSKEKPSYQFKSFRLDLAERQLSNDAQLVPLTPKAFDMLAFLVERSGHLVEKDEIMRSIWADSFVEEGNLARIVHTLRRTLGEDQNENKFIETVAKKGYRFVAEVKQICGNEAQLPIGTPPFAQSPRNREQAESAAVSGSSTIVSRRHEFDKHKGSRWSQPRIVLFLTLGIIFTVSVLGFWFTNKLRIAKFSASGASHQSNNGEAYQLYLQGKLLLDRKLDGDFTTALANFERAVELDPNYAEAYVGKADAKIWSFWGSGSHDDISQARTAINKALELDPTNSYAHTLLCRIKVTYDWDFDGGERSAGGRSSLTRTAPKLIRNGRFF